MYIYIYIFMFNPNLWDDRLSDHFMIGFNPICCFKRIGCFVCL